MEGIVGHKKKIPTLMLMLLMIFGLGMSMPARAEAAVKVSKVTVKSPTGSKKTVYVGEGKSVQLKTTVKVNPNKKTNKKVTYKSGNEKIATVNSKGKITGKQTGTTKITVTSQKNAKKKATISVKVVKPSTKVSLKTKKGTLYIGDTVKLKASVKAPAGGYKGVTWSTSNKKAATVTQKGVVKGRKAGKAKIKAKAADGSGKSATYTVTVKSKPVSVSGLTFKNPYNNSSTYRIVVTLSGAKALQISNFTIKTKAYEKGTYNRTVKIEDLYTANNKDYILELENSISNGHYVQCTVSGIDGSKKVEKQFKASGYAGERLIAGIVGTEVNTTLNFRNMLGYHQSKVTSGSLPSGLSLKNESGYSQIEGTVKSLANNKKVVVTGTDEVGTKSKSTVNFLIGNAATMYAENKTKGQKTDDIVYTNQYFWEFLYVAGGSGSYTATLVNSYDGMFYIDYVNNYASSGYGCAEICANSDKLTKAGTYNLQVRFTDTANPARTATGTLKVVVKGKNTITSILSGATENQYIYYKNIETGDVFSAYSFSSNNTQISYVPNGTYEVYLYSYGEKIVLKKSVTISKSETFTYTAPKTYKISGTVTDKNGAVYDDECRVRIYKWGKTDEFDYLNSYYTDNDGKYEFNMVPAGSYMIRVYYYSNGYQLGYTSSKITVSNNNVTQNVKLSIAKTVKVTVSGTLKDSYGNSIDDDWEVYLYGSNDNWIKDAYSYDGKYSFSNVESGTYYLRIYDDDGDWVMDTERFTVGTSNRTWDVVIYIGSYQMFSTEAEPAEVKNVESETEEVESEPEETEEVEPESDNADPLNADDQLGNMPDSGI